MKHFGICVNTQKDNVFPVITGFLYRLMEQDIPFCINEEARAFLNDPLIRRFCVSGKELVERSDILLSFGGDGTLLSTARLAGDSGKPILGVNIGKLGFLTEVEIKELDEAIRLILEGLYFVEERMMMQAESDIFPTPLYAFNDFVIVRKDAIRMIRIRVEVDEDFLQTYTADGLIIASPTGSTAYSLSSNGPIISPSLDALIINPICPHVLTMRPLVISSRQTVRVELQPPSHALFSSDGVIEADLRYRQVVIIREADRRIRLIRLGKRSFFEILRTKLNWGEDIRNIPT